MKRGLTWKLLSQTPEPVLPALRPLSSVTFMLTDGGRALSMTGSPEGAAPGTSWLAAHLDEFPPLYLSYWLSLKVIQRQIQASLTDRQNNVEFSCDIIQAVLLSINI